MYIIKNEKSDIDNIIKEYYEINKEKNRIEKRLKKLSPIIKLFLNKQISCEYNTDKYKAKLVPTTITIWNTVKLIKKIGFKAFCQCITIVKKEVENYLNKKEIEEITSKTLGSDRLTIDLIENEK